MERSTRQLISIILWVVAGFLLTNLIISKAGWNDAVLPFALIFVGVVIWLWDWLALGVGGSTPPAGDDDSSPKLPARPAQTALPAADSHSSALPESGVTDHFGEEDFQYRLTGTDIGEMTDEFPAVVLPPEESSASLDAATTTPAAEAGAGGTSADSSAPVAVASESANAAPAGQIGAAIAAGAADGIAKANSPTREVPAITPEAEVTAPSPTAGEAITAGVASGEAAPASQPVSAEAPAKAAPAAEATAPAEPAAPAPVSRAASTSGKGDDLTVIEGIGPKMNAALIAAGISTFAQLAQTDLDHIHKAIEAAGMRFAPSAPTWAEQAAYAAKGDWDGLNAFQDSLTAGRRK